MPPTPERVCVSVSGSFNRHLDQVRDAVEAFTRSGACVLSPQDPRPVQRVDGFLFVASDLRRCIKGVQDRHLQAIDRSRLLWLVCPHGYVGSSAALEVGYAAACGTPVLASCPPTDLTLRQYVEVCASPAAALERLRCTAGDVQTSELPARLLEPTAALTAAHDELEHVAASLVSAEPSVQDPAQQHIQRVGRLLHTPGRGRRCRR